MIGRVVFRMPWGTVVDYRSNAGRGDYVLISVEELELVVVGVSIDQIELVEVCEAFRDWAGIPRGPMAAQTGAWGLLTFPVQPVAAHFGRVIAGPADLNTPLDSHRLNVKPVCAG